MIFQGNSRPRPHACRQGAESVAWHYLPFPAGSAKLPSFFYARRAWIATPLTLLVACGLAWQVATKSLVAHLAKTAPESALALAPGNSEALMNLAEEKLGLKHLGRYVVPDESGPPQSAASSAAMLAIATKGIPAPMVRPEISAPLRSQIRGWAHTALLHDPLDARALRILGQVADSDQQTSTYMQKSVARSRHEPLAVYWLMQQAYLEADYDKAGAYADVLLRSQTLFSSILAPVIGRMAETRKGLDVVKSLLLKNPPWRRAFFYALVNGIKDARTPLQLMLDMQTNGLPPTNEELNFYISFLMQKELYELAYYAWLQFLPEEAVAEAGLLSNGNFTSTSSGLPFDWNITQGSGSRIEFVDRADKAGRKALKFEFTEGMVSASNIQQIVVLPQGSYWLRGLAMGNIRARQGLRWHVACYPRSWEPLAESDAFVGVVADWKAFAVEFKVPSKNCKAQQIWLSLEARSDSERLASGSAWFSELSLTPKLK